MWTVISLAGERRTLHMPSSRFRCWAASSNRTSAAIHGFFSCSSESVVGKGILRLYYDKRSAADERRCGCRREGVALHGVAAPAGPTPSLQMSKGFNGVYIKPD